MNLAAFLVYCIVVTFTPGPTNIVILSTVQHNSLKQAMKYVWGATLAFGLLLAASALLNRMLAGVLPGVLTVMQVIGSLYMLYLAVQIYRMNTAEAQHHNTSGFASGLLMQFINPKVILFTLTVIPGYVLPYYSSPLILTVFVIVITVIGFLAFMAWLVFGTVFRAFLQAHRRTANTVMALFMIYSAVMVSGIF
ncbi:MULTISPECIES: LysE family transporter [unclassified Paenibacillus]|uniref:LysE family translocator n=1 Tax=unclassified Paenibacillus TaxID=185978 RepID=UPI002406CACE|nr:MULTISPECIES: LysE family transporter [unclassified Paenibacillus]MDF9841535.1 cysteine/O-acetylserine efflux protein [Paenibacillus sp. PastF-2]MDF9848124.1 cysteine/O-acetylserine efflux protein [Paenibacillus sp. PastM-2]MDF9854693.1 cysteine/O-acetylserine efflux protein [Paenibacillus sp. PastF-1]MDH6479699.1 cysteine/O-acetylserine efflux protein [Paenibacillus sp. PastH-2]MDH6507398.1 cysteine/O-acetylserine efflux protein [Paenibacillus sp. PastM-3]